MSNASNVKFQIDRHAETGKHHKHVTLKNKRQQSLFFANKIDENPLFRSLTFTVRSRTGLFMSTDTIRKRTRMPNER